MVRVYTAGPYRAKHWWGVLVNIYSAWYIARELWRRGFAVLCPHTDTIVMSQEIFRKRGVDCRTIMRGELDLLRMCDVVLMLPGWQNSEGSLAEREYAWEHRIPVVYSVEELEEKRREIELCRV